MKKVIDFIKPAAILLIVAAVVALVLGLVDMMTRDRIEAIAQETKTNAMKAVLDASSYEQLTLDNAPADVNEVYAAEGGGWVVQVTETGSQGSITLMVGVSPDLACTGISVTDSSETAGLGAIASQQSTAGENFRSQFVGQTGTVAVTKDGGTINALTGATITSRAISTGVTSALALCETLG